MRAALEAWRRRGFERFAVLQDFGRVLMKPRNGLSWTEEDRRFLREGFRALGRLAPPFLLFLLPGGFPLAAAYAWLLDRRRKRRPEARTAGEQPLT